jgi:hypothetical protein
MVCVALFLQVGIISVMVLFVSKTREHDALYQAAFLPIVNSVEILP